MATCQKLNYLGEKMNTFTNAARGQSNITYTEKGGIALKSTGSYLLDLFSVIGAMRLKTYEEVATMLKNAMSEDKLLAVKMAFYARNIRGGLGEREVFRKMLLWLAQNEPEVVKKNMEYIPFFGRWDDLYVLVGTPVEGDMWAMLSFTIMKDLENMKAGKPISLCAKWLKSVNTSSKKSVELAKETANQFHMSEKQYRKTLAKLREHIKITERYMSSGEWDEITYSQVPSRAMKNYRKAFGRHDPDGFGTFITKVQKGEEKIHSGTLYPYDIMKAGHLKAEGSYWNRYGNFRLDNDAVLEEQWKALPNYVDGEFSMLVMADTSGSMEIGDATPIATSIGLAIYFAERNKGAFKDLFMTFSEEPRFVTLKGNTLAEKVACVPAIVENTYLEKAFDLILETGKRNNVSPEDMPKALCVISDMQFDSAMQDRRSGYYKQTFHQSMVDKYTKAGYVIPKVIYWQVCARGEALQATKDDENIMLVSGQGTSVFKSILHSLTHTPYELMLEVLNDKQYDVIKI